MLLVLLILVAWTVLLALVAALCAAARVGDEQPAPEEHAIDPAAARLLPAPSQRAREAGQGPVRIAA